MKKRVYLYIIIGILGAALILRLMGLDKGIWVDEWGSIYVSQGGGLLETLIKLRNYDHPPLYYMMLHLWSKLGDSEVFLRLPSVLMGIGTVFVAMMWLRLYSSPASVLVGVLLGAAPMLLRYSQEIRDYPLLLLATSLAFFFASRITINPETFSNYLGLGISLTMAVATHLLGIFLILPVCIFVYTMSEAGKTVCRSKLIVAIAIPVGVFLFFRFFYLLDVDKSHGWWVPPISRWMISYSTRNLFGLSTFPWPWDATKRVLLVALPCFAIVLAFGNWRRNYPFLIAALIYWLQVLAYTVLITPIFYDRFLLPSLIPLLGFIALQTVSIEKKILRIASIAVCVAVSLTFALNWAGQAAWEPVEPWKQMSRLLERQWQGKTGALVFYPAYCAGPVRYYFSHLQSVATCEVMPGTGEEELARSVSSMVSSIEKSPIVPHVFLIVRYDFATSKDTKTLQLLLSILKGQMKEGAVVTMLSFNTEPSEGLFRTVASMVGPPSHVQDYGSFVSSQYELHPRVSPSSYRP
jgi:hypothetical protein